MTARDDSEQLNDGPDSEEKRGADEGIGGENDGSTEIEGDDSHLHEDQKSPRLKV